MDPGLFGDAKVGALRAEREIIALGFLGRVGLLMGILRGGIPRDPTPKRFRDFRDYKYQFQDSFRVQESATMANIFNNYGVILTSVLAEQCLRILGAFLV